MSVPTQYLEPVSSEFPCGDPDSAGQIWQLDALFEPTGELLEWKPDWKEANKVVSRLLPTCKHIKLGLVYMGVALQQEGLPGFRDAMSMLHEWMERYWGQLYPQLDTEVPDAYEQMLQRVNELRTLTSQGIGGITVLSWLYGVTICRSRSFDRLGFRQVGIVRGKFKPAEGEPIPSIGGEPMTPNQLEEAFKEFRAADPGALETQLKCVTESHEILKKIDTLISEKAGPGRGPSFSEMYKALEELQGFLESYLDGGSVAETKPAEGAEPAGSADAGAQPVTGKAGGKVASREDVVRSIDAICKYYAQFEPSSPVPLLLARAKALVKMDFLAIVENLTPESAEAARRLLVGAKTEGEQSGGS